MSPSKSLLQRSLGIGQLVIGACPSLRAISIWVVKKICKKQLNSEFYKIHPHVKGMLDSSKSCVFH
jgi:hypothetical protein